MIRTLSKTYDHVEELAVEIKSLLDSLERNTVRHLVRIGQLLQSASETFARLKLKNHGTGVFWKWVRQRLGMRKTTAFKWMRVVEVFGDCSHCEQFTKSALYLLSDPSTPGAARKDSLEAAAKGLKVDVRRAKCFIEAHTPKSSEPKSDFNLGPLDDKKKSTPLDWLKKGWRCATPKEKRFFADWVEHQDDLYYRLVELELQTAARPNRT